MLTSSSFSLHHAISQSNFEKSSLTQKKGLIECGYSSIYDVDNYGRTALIKCSCERNKVNLDIARYLLDCGSIIHPFDANAQSNVRWYNWTALMTASYYGYIEMIKLLIEYNVDFNLVDLNGRIACQIAQEMNNTECVELILIEMENKSTIKPEQIIELHDALFNNNFEIASQILLSLDEKAKFILNSNESASQTFLYRASRSGNAKMVELLIEYGAMARPHCYTKYSPLYVACHVGSYEIASLILNRFSKLVNLSTIENFLPIHAACALNHFEIVKLLMEFNYSDDLMMICDDKTHENALYLFAFDLNSIDVNQISILHAAVNSGNVEMCEYLLNFKLKTYIKQYFTMFDTKKQREYRLNEFIQKSKCKMIKLKDDESFYDILNNHITNETTIFYDSTQPSVKFINENHEKIVQIEEDYGLSNPIDPNIYSKFGLTCLHEAVLKGNLSLVKLLLENRANLNLPIIDSNLKTISNVLIESITKKNEDILRYLLKNEHLSQETLNFAFEFSLNLLNSESATLNIKYFSVLLTKIQLQKDTDTRIVEKYAQKYYKRLSGCGLILQMSEFSSNLKCFYESWFVSIIKSNNQTSFNCLTKLDLSYNSLQEVPFCIFEMENLRVLKLNNNELKELPVKKSQFDDTSFKHFSKFDYKCNLLEDIDLSNNNLCELTPKIFSLESLKHLNISKNDLYKLPFELWSCYSLMELNISNNRLNSLPLNHHITTKIPKNLSLNLGGEAKQVDVNFQYVERPVLKVNIWSKYLSTEDSLTSYQYAQSKKKDFESGLIDLNLSHNEFTQIPACLACLAPNLLKLNLSNNRIKSLGAVSDYPKNIKLLDLSDNQIEDQMKMFNSEILESTLLKEGDFCVLKNTPVPRSSLTLSSTNRRSKNDEKLKQIKIRSRSYSRNPLNRLRISEAKIYTGENELDSERLEFLTDKLCSHKNHTRLENLKTLNLASNRLKNFDLIFNVKKNGLLFDITNYVDDSDTDLHKFHKILLFPNLTHLDLSSNLIEILDENYAKLTNISNLNLSCNPKLQEISTKIGLLTKLWNFDLKNCPNIRDPVLNDLIIKPKTKTSDILAYLKSILENSRQYSKIKLMILGVRSTGKTSLVYKLSGCRSIESPLTIAEWTYEGNYDQSVSFVNSNDTSFKHFGPITYRIWDFAKDDPTYQYFLSKRALYLVCWKLSDEEKGVNELHDILLNIQTRVPRSSVILVATHQDQSAKLNKHYKETSSMLQRLIYERYIRPSENENSPYPQICASIEISSKSGHNIKQLANIIYHVSCQMKLYGSKDQLMLEQKVPVCYLILESCLNSIVTRLKSLNRVLLLNKQDYLKEVRAQIQVQSGKKQLSEVVIFRNDEEILQATQFLHDNGILTHFNSSLLQNWFFIDNHWLLNILTCMLDIKKPLVTLNEIKEKLKYPLEDHLIIGMLDKCELGLTWDGTNILVSSLLRSEILNLMQGLSTDSVILDISSILRRLYSIVFIPSGLFSRLMVRIMSDMPLAMTILELNQKNKWQIDWNIWKSGIELQFNQQKIFHVKNLMNEPLLDKIHHKFLDNSILYADCENELKLKKSNESALIEFCIFERGSDLDKRLLVKILAQLNEILDALLEDFYPDLGTRFMQDSKGDYLVTRLIPCLKCVNLEETLLDVSDRLKPFLNMNWIYCFMLDDVCFSILKQVDLKCPKHGIQVANEIAPDVSFSDIDSNLFITQNNLYFDRLLGRGSFGAVYYGLIKTSLNKTAQIGVAIKALESINSTDLNMRKSIRLATKSYSIARQEILMLNYLAHENIVGMIGLSLMPLSIILELATVGNLAEVIEDYKKTLCYLHFSLIKQTCVQISSALEYLHSHLIVYRDLKSENILVWSFPKPQRFDVDSRVFVKLADFSISRASLPTGTKGFAGTEGFMAPEIIRFNGEECYTEKVDCFSFGMLLYELLSLKHPFEGKEQIKDLILSGARPSISTYESIFPSLMLDLMCLCWSENPNDRPSAKEIHQIVLSHEFDHLLDINILQNSEFVPLIAHQMRTESIENNLSIDLVDLWVVKNTQDDSKFDILTFESSLNCTTRKEMNVCSEKIDALCVHKCQLWCIDTMKCIYVFCMRTFTKINQFLLAISLKSEMVSMISVESIDKIILCTKNGYVVLIDALFESLNDDLNFSSFQVPIQVFCAGLVPIKNDKNYDLWLGSENSQIHVYTLTTMKLNGIFDHSNKVFNHQRQDHFKASPNETLTFVKELLVSEENVFLWTYVHPYCKIYLWNYLSRTTISSCDLKKILSSYSQLCNQGKDLTVIKLLVANSNLIVGTNGGVILILKKLTLIPILQFKSHVELFTFELTKFQIPNESTSDIFQSKSRKNKKNQVLVTVGRGLSPTHEDLYLRQSQYRLQVDDLLKNYAMCLVFNAWNLNEI